MNKSTILLIGASGLLGKKLLETVPQDFDVIPTFHRVPVPTQNGILLDITNQTNIRQVLTAINPTIVIHAASLVYVDYCQSHKKEAWEVNVEGTRKILDLVKERNAKFIFFSSNALYGGRKAPYSETDNTNPLNYYGVTKLAAEKIVLSYLSKSIIYRLNTMYGWNYPNARKNPATWTVERLTNGLTTYAVIDNYNSHLWVGQAAAAVWTGIKNEFYGEIFQVGGSECINRFEFCCNVAKVFGLDATLLKPVKSSYFTRIAKRPFNSCFNSRKMEQKLKIKAISTYEGLKRMRYEANYKSD
jgi:dTDP-4-dehydrorhamnose reductase